MDDRWFGLGDRGRYLAYLAAKHAMPKIQLPRMKLPKISLFTLIVLPALLVAVNCVALSWLSYSNIPRLVHVSQGNFVNAAMDVRFAGWPFWYNVAFVNVLDENKRRRR